STTKMPLFSSIAMPIGVTISGSALNKVSVRLGSLRTGTLSCAVEADKAMRRRQTNMDCAGRAKRRRRFGLGCSEGASVASIREETVQPKNPQIGRAHV